MDADVPAAPLQEDVYSGHFRSDGRLLVVGSSRGFVQALDVATKASLRKFQGHRGPVHVAQWAPDGGTHIVTAGDDRSVRCWDLTTGKGVATVEHAHDDYVRCGGSTPAAPNLWATGSYDHCVRLWDVRGLGGGGGGGAPGAAGGGSAAAAVQSGAGGVMRASMRWIRPGRLMASRMARKLACASNTGSAKPGLRWVIAWSPS
jgi:hypothetical protein